MRSASGKASSFTESVIREMTRLAMAHDAVNLAQGMPDFACPPELKEAACAAIEADLNQYAITWGATDLRQAIAVKTARHYPDWRVDPETDVTVTCGATEGMIASMLALLDPGDELIVFEPFYENYGPDAILSGAIPRYVALHEPEWSFDEAELRAAFGPRTRGIVVNSPHNPTGKVFSPSELEFMASASSTTSSPSPTRSTSTSSMRALTSRWQPCPAWPSARSPSTRSRRRTQSPAGASAGSSRRRR